MLPFMKKRQESGLSGLLVKNRQPDEKEPFSEEESSSAAIESCAKDLIMAVHAHDVKGAAEAMKHAFDILESMPHEEAPHEQGEI